MFIKKYKEIKKTLKLLGQAENELKKIYDDEKDFHTKYSVIQPQLLTLRFLQYELLNEISIFFLKYLTA